MTLSPALKFACDKRTATWACFRVRFVACSISLHTASAFRFGISNVDSPVPTPPVHATKARIAKDKTTALPNLAALKLSWILVTAQSLALSILKADGKIAPLSCTKHVKETSFR